MMARSVPDVLTIAQRFVLAFAALCPLPAQQPQNPSPMVEHTRAHQRLNQESPPGRRENLETGDVLFVPAGLRPNNDIPLLVHFHGAAWVAEKAAAELGRTAAITVQAGAGSGRYSAAFSDPSRFAGMLAEAERKAGLKFGPLILTAFSAGHGAIREILRQPAFYERVQNVLLIDGLHTGYVGGKPGQLESSLVEEDLEIFVRFARDAVEGRKRMLVSHSEIFPGTFASTTETADYLLRELGLRRKPVLRWGPLGMQQLSEVRRGGFLLLGYAGNSAPDHIDHYHAMPHLLRLLWK